MNEGSRPFVFIRRREGHQAGLCLPANLTCGPSSVGMFRDGALFCVFYLMALFSPSPPPLREVAAQINGKLWTNPGRRPLVSVPFPALCISVHLSHSISAGLSRAASLLSFKVTSTATHWLADHPHRPVPPPLFVALSDGTAGQLSSSPSSSRPWVFSVARENTPCLFIGLVLTCYGSEGRDSAKCRRHGTGD
jgi:hypothetical protein